MTDGDETCQSEAVPENLDSFRITLQRRLANHNRAWRFCPSRACERARRCCDDALLCVVKQPSPTTPEQDAEAAFSLRQMLDEARRRKPA